VLNNQITTTTMDVTVRVATEGMTLEEVSRTVPARHLILGDIRLDIVAVDKAEDL